MKCPKCDNGTLIFNEKWDIEFDRLDKNVPAGDIIANMLAQRGIPKYICDNCDNRIMKD